MDRRWDVFVRGNWSGRLFSRTKTEAEDRARVMFAENYLHVTVAEFFGAGHPKNCKHSGGEYPNPEPHNYIGKAPIVTTP